MSNSKSVFVLGSYVAGCIAAGQRMPEPGETVRAEAFVLQPGGKGFNLMAGLHRLGVMVDGILPIGDDLWGRMAPTIMGELGLPPEWLFPLDGPSGGAVGLVGADGENCIAIFPGANAKVSANDIRCLASRVQNASIVAAQFEVAEEAIVTAFDMAREAGITTLLNPSPYHRTVERLLSYTDILVINETEARSLAADLGLRQVIGSDVNSLRLFAETIHERGVDQIVITLGASGSLVFRAGHEIWGQAAWPVEVVDTTGAGDAFCAGLVAALLEGLPMAVALQHANASGALVCRGMGVFDNLACRSEILECVSSKH